MKVNRKQDWVPTAPSCACCWETEGSNLFKGKVSRLRVKVVLLRVTMRTRSSPKICQQRIVFAAQWVPRYLVEVESSSDITGMHLMPFSNGGSV